MPAAPGPVRAIALHGGVALLAAVSRLLEPRTRPLSRTVSLAVALGIAAALAISAQLRIPLPFTPVPVTLQTLVVSLGAAWAGPATTIGAVLLYAAAALAGVPVLSGFRGGPEAFVGATAGYIVGWLLAAFVIGRLLDGRPTSWSRAVSVLSLGTAVILFCGALHLALFLGLSITQTLLMGVVPFLPGDVLKIALAAGAVRRWPNPGAPR